jgi:long-chain acyl-CoA synthetase
MDSSTVWLLARVGTAASSGVDDRASKGCVQPWRIRAVLSVLAYRDAGDIQLVPSQYLKGEAMTGIGNTGDQAREGINVARHVERWSASTPDRPALCSGGECLDFRTLDQAASRYARRLASMDVGVGDRVALLIGNHPSFVYAYLACLKLGAIAVTLNPRMSMAELGPILDNASPAVILTARHALEPLPLGSAGRRVVVVPVADDIDTPAKLSAVALADTDYPAVAMPADAPATIVYTSGTTATPKGVTLSHANILSNIEAKRQLLGITPTDRALLFLPLFHCFGQNAVMNAVFQSGGCVELQPGFSPDAILQSLRDSRISLFFGVPATFAMLLEADPADFAGVRLFFCAAAKLTVELEKRWEARFGAPIHQGYGLSETSPFATYNHAERHKPGSVGVPIPGVAVRVVSPWSGADVGAGEVGELWIKGPNVMLGYWGRPDATAAAIQDGWLKSGDLGWRDPDGYLQLLDRLDDLVIVGGQNVCPAQVEDVLYRHPSVRDAAVFGVAHPTLGEVVAAQVCLGEGFCTTDELLGLCRAALAEHKVPRRIELVESIPRSPSGKILKRILREAAAPITATELGAAEDAASPRDAASIESWLTQWLSKHLGVPADDLDPFGSFASLQVSSLGLVMLMADLGQWMGLDLPASLPWSYTTMRDLSAQVATLAGAGRTQTAGVANLSQVAGQGAPAGPPLDPPRRGSPYQSEAASEQATQGASLRELLARELDAAADTLRALNGGRREGGLG